MAGERSEARPHREDEGPDDDMLDDMREHYSPIVFDDVVGVVEHLRPQAPQADAESGR